MTSKVQKNRFYKISFMILGLKGDFTSIKLDDKNVIRRATKKEVEKINHITEVDYTFKYVIESHYESKEFPQNNSEAFELLARVNFFLHLYTNGSVVCPAGTKHILSNNTYLSAGSLLDRKINTYNPGNYNFQPDDRRKIKRSWRHFLDCCNENNRPFKIAWHRYLFSLSKYNEEDRLIDLMIVLEALFLKNSEREGLGFRLRLRIITLLTQKFNRNQLAQFLKNTYNLRSKIVHGANTTGNQFTFRGEKLGLTDVIRQLDIIIETIFKEYIQYWQKTNIPNFIDQLDRFIFTGVEYKRSRIVSDDLIREINDLNNTLKFVLKIEPFKGLTLDEINKSLSNSTTRKKPDVLDKQRVIELLNILQKKSQLYAIPGVYKESGTGKKEWYFEMF